MLRALLLAVALSVIPSIGLADEVVDYAGLKFYLTKNPCGNDVLEFYAAMAGVDPEGLKAGRVEGRDLTDTGTGEDYKAAMCYKQLSGEHIFVVDENGNMGAVPYEPKLVM